MFPAKLSDLNFPTGSRQNTLGTSNRSTSRTEKPPSARALYSGVHCQTISVEPPMAAGGGFAAGTCAQAVGAVGERQYCPALANSTSTRNSISDKRESRPGSPEEDLRLAAAWRSLFTVEASKLPDSSPILRSSRTSNAPRPRCTERFRRSAGSSWIPCNASSASILAAAFGALAERISEAELASGKAKPDELVRLAVAAGDPRMVPFGRRCAW